MGGDGVAVADVKVGVTDRERVRSPVLVHDGESVPSADWDTDGLGEGDRLGGVRVLPGVKVPEPEGPVPEHVQVRVSDLVPVLPVSVPQDLVNVDGVSVQVRERSVGVGVQLRVPGEPLSVQVTDGVLVREAVGVRRSVTGALADSVTDLVPGDGVGETLGVEADSVSLSDADARDGVIRPVGVSDLELVRARVVEAVELGLGLEVRLQVSVKGALGGLRVGVGVGGVGVAEGVEDGVSVRRPEGVAVGAVADADVRDRVLLREALGVGGLREWVPVGVGVTVMPPGTVTEPVGVERVAPLSVCARLRVDGLGLCPEADTLDVKLRDEVAVPLEGVCEDGVHVAVKVKEGDPVALETV